MLLSNLIEVEVEVNDIRCHIYNSFAEGIIVQVVIKAIIFRQTRNFLPLFKREQG
jgi:hypothetical protein